MSVATLPVSSTFLAFQCALLHHIAGRVGEGYRPGVLEVTNEDVRGAGWDVARDMGLDPETGAEYSDLRHRPVPAELTVGLVLSGFDPFWRPGEPQQLAVASKDDHGPRTFWWSVDGVSVYEA